MRKWHNKYGARIINPKGYSYMTNQEKLGDLGEQFAAEILGIKLSENKYDMEKDGTIGEVKVEIKTQNRHPYLDYFTINTRNWNQLPKCLSVDRLLFVEYDISDKIRLWECHDREDYRRYTTKGGLFMAGWPINKMKLLRTVVHSNLAAEMRKYSGAEFTK